MYTMAKYLNLPDNSDRLLGLAIPTDKLKKQRINSINYQPTAQFDPLGRGPISMHAMYKGR